MPRFSGQQTVATYSILFKCAERSLKAAQEDERGSFYELLNCLVMSAFSVEAYINHLGAILSEDFKKFENKNVWDKYKKLRKLTSLSNGGIPEIHPVIAKLLDFRNLIAHGKTENNGFDLDVPELVLPLPTEPQVIGWRTYVTRSIAEEVVESVKLLVSELHSAAGEGEFPFSTTVTGMYSLTASTQAN